MRQLISFVLVITCCFTLASVASASATEDSGFQENFAFISKESFSSQPKTLEATVRFPLGTPNSLRGGVIFGSYNGAGGPCVNFEIHQNGNPRLYITDQSGTTYDIKFNSVNVYTGEWVNIAIVADSASALVHCYIDGALAETVENETPETLPAINNAVIGGDMRAGNGQYFKGEIKDLVLYSDVRTEKEIAEDYKADKPDTSSLLGYYKPDTTKDTVQCLAGDGPDFPLTTRETFIEDYESVTDYEYSFALIGDIQTITRNYPDKLHYIYDWIVENADDKKIAFVAGLGDITDASSYAEWILAKEEMSKLDGVVPYSFVRGNHDYATSFTDVFTYNEYKDTITGSFDETMLNTYHTFSVKGIKYLFLNLDVAATDEMLDWANEIISSHEDYNVIITTHIYMAGDGNLFDESAASSLNRYGVYNYPDIVWDKVVSQHENISMVICGHDPSDRIVVNKREGVNGNLVTEILVDPQTTDKTYEGTGLVAMLYFSDGGKTVDIEYYSTIKEAHFLAENQFSTTVETVFPTLRLYYGLAIGGIALLVIIAAVVTIIIIRKKRAKSK